MESLLHYSYDAPQDSGHMNLPRLVFHLMLGRRLPKISGSLKVPGVAQPVLIRRDGYGIPHIEAKNDFDAWYGLGFCHGQDRRFQIDGLSRVVRGTVSEVMGQSGLGIDRLSRRVGFFHSATEQFQILRPAYRSMLEAYARGVNEGTAFGCRRKAHEFTLLRSEVVSYTAEDAIGVTKLQSFAMASNWDVELARLQILKKDGPEALQALDPSYPEWQPVSVPPGAPAGPSLERLAADMKAMGAVAGGAGGSNNWVLAPSRTETGRPILANDAHLAPSLPPRWYLAHLRTPDWEVSGATFAGAPGFPAGHNGAAAWGITAGLVDNTDLFIEELSQDGLSVREGDGFVNCDVREEVIKVKGYADVVEDVLVTPRGPIVGPALNAQLEAVSIKATWLANRPANGFLGVHKVRSFQEFRDQFREWPYMSLNMVYADKTGAIGTQLVGDVPKRRGGWGTIPDLGWKPRGKWGEALVPFDDLPHESNPPGGILATANNQPTVDDKGPFLGVDWLDGYRAARIFEVLSERSDWQISSTMKFQMDQRSGPWQEMRGVVLSVHMKSGDSSQALDLLREWDGEVAADSVGASVFQLLIAQLSSRLAMAKAPKSYPWAIGQGPESLLPHNFFSVRRVGHLVRLLRDKPEGWFEEGWDAIIDDAMGSAVDFLKERYGKDPSGWKWGQVRPLTLRHPAGTRRLFGSIFNLGPIPCGGDANTVSQAAQPLESPTSNPLAIASMRMVIDVGNWDSSRFSMPGGQSGNPLSPHYGDLLPYWIRGEGVPLAWSPGFVEASTIAELSLMPIGETV